jgi:hypothetical protein
VPEDLIYGASYLGIARTDDIVMIQFPLVLVAPEGWPFGNGRHST